MKRARAHAASLQGRRGLVVLEGGTIQITCPKCGSDVQTHLGIAPSVLQQAVRLQTAQHGAIAFCQQCNSYFLFGPGAISDAIHDSAAADKHDADMGDDREGQHRE